ncbi:hypothetical protein [Shimia sp.]|uniref:hypothetical protein n=1 Tax=Shimia sp. TaxID=1954381 RepID=UPI003296CD6B
MSTPFVIWTMRRTGGTTLTDLLMTLSEYPKVEHEPFNEDRIFGPISIEWYAHKEPARTVGALETAVRAHPLIKHCFEIHGLRFNNLLLRNLNRLGYRQIILRREDEVARILSLQLAEATGVWGKMGSERGYAYFREEGAPELRFDIAAAQAHLEHCFKRWTWLEQKMLDVGITPFQLRFEDLYGDLERGKETVRKVFDHIDIPPDSFEEHKQTIENALRYKGQNSGSVMSLVKNIDEAQARLQNRLDILNARPAS